MTFYLSKKPFLLLSWLAFCVRSQTDGNSTPTNFKMAYQFTTINNNADPVSTPAEYSQHA